MTELRFRRDQIDGADMVELRLDYVEDPDVSAALAGRKLPVVVTCRPTWEGGRFKGSEEERRRLLQQALELGAEYVDLEWRGGFDEVIRRCQGRNVILSLHDFDGIPRDLSDQYRAMCATGANVVKVAIYANRLSDTLALLELVSGKGQEGRVLLAMGPAGVVSRVLPDRFGSSWTYAGEGVAPGQISLQEFLVDFRVRSISEETALYGVVGSPLVHSLSPSMHNAGFAAMKHDAVYVPLEAADVDDFWTFAAKMRVRGVSVTAPFKEQILSGLSLLDPLASRVGAVNTVRATSEGWEGINTDVPGFLEPLVERLDLKSTRATVIGAGGAARAVAVALASEGAQVSVCARNLKRASEVAELVSGEGALIPPVPDSWDLLVNTTPVGTFPGLESSPLPGGPFGGDVVYDLVYNPLITRLMRDAKSAGCGTIGGLEMLVAQAVRQFEWWTGLEAPIDEFREAAKRAVSRGQFYTSGDDA